MIMSTSATDPGSTTHRLCHFLKSSGQPATSSDSREYVVQVPLGPLLWWTSPFGVSRRDITGNNVLLLPLMRFGSLVALLTHAGIDPSVQLRIYAIVHCWCTRCQGPCVLGSSALEHPNGSGFYVIPFAGDII